MRARITRAFFAAAAAGATITSLSLAGPPAGAAIAGHHHAIVAFTPSGGTPIGSAADCGGSIPGSLFGLLSNGQDNVGNNNSTSPTLDCAQAGYVATGRDFRFAQATIRVPNHSPDLRVDPWSYVALDTGTAPSAIPDFARIGIGPCFRGPAGWCVFTAVVDPSLPNPTLEFFPLPNAVEGDGVLVQAYFNQIGNEVNFTAYLPTTRTPLVQYGVEVHGPIYTRAEALADWGPAAVVSRAAAPVPPADDKVRDTQFLTGAFTTLSGAKGTFKGPWVTTGVQATSNGQLEPAGTLIGDPSFLWNDGHGLGPGDAFGVWRYPF